MNWRPWIIAAGLLGSILTNALLLWQERIDPPAGTVALVDERKDPIKGFPPRAPQRKKNLQAMGLNEKLVEAADREAARLKKERGDVYREKLQEFGADVAALLCTTTDLPPRYAAMGFLVTEESGQRVPVDPRDLQFELKRHDWYATSMVPDVYDHLELSSDRREDATVMGIAAIFLKQERAVLQDESPWASTGVLGRWSFDQVVKKYPEVELRLVEYFALMHVFVELANEDDGICG